MTEATREEDDGRVLLVFRGKEAAQPGGVEVRRRRVEGAVRGIKPRIREETHHHIRRGGKGHRMSHLQRVRTEVEEKLPTTLLRGADVQAGPCPWALGVSFAAVVVGPAALAHYPTVVERSHGRPVRAKLRVTMCAPASCARAAGAWLCWNSEPTSMRDQPSTPVRERSVLQKAWPCTRPHEFSVLF